jgi:hypothetical protein
MEKLLQEFFIFCFSPSSLSFHFIRVSRRDVCIYKTDEVRISLKLDCLMKMTQKNKAKLAGAETTRSIRRQLHANNHSSYATADVNELKYARRAHNWLCKCILYMRWVRGDAASMQSASCAFNYHWKWNQLASRYTIALRTPLYIHISMRSVIWPMNSGNWTTWFMFTYLHASKKCRLNQLKIISLRQLFFEKNQYYKQQSSACGQINC